MDEISKIVAENISRLLKARDMSQVELAKAAGIDKNYLNKIINGKR